ncbi:uncharacterized protein TA18735 [Theileria annulata]|uniref:E3 UFM1-protein ligase 1-like N-terminal domain-containing protein n=1 Tax=Theileria annulata TaxID=5874 RepID=Q4UBE1_THEAN|nr:uncharacterized protein TA18735 [Theileria annulata]CAI75860.1 hypothetical protein, conserved [Theileria annulata]|eukprot:XP_955336.1 hypothetical protein, conserved [Theileria annulata]
MVSISELRSRLASAQSTKSKLRLSNLQCIDILLKICKKKGVDLITSTDGMLFYTLEEVQAEVENELLSRGGRIPIFELNSVLNFQPDHIDRAVSNIVRPGGEYLNSHGVIISKQYLNHLMYSVNDRIQECGTVGISELSKEYDLPLEMIRSYVSSNLGTVIKGNINGNSVESFTFEQRKLNNFLASILAITMPIQTNDLSRIINQNINTVNDTLNNLIKQGKANGVIKGNEFVPQCYINSVDTFLTNYYTRNGYIEVTLINSFDHFTINTSNKHTINGVKHSKSTKTSNKPIKHTSSTVKNDTTMNSHGGILDNSVKLETVYINKELFEPVSILINEAISNRSWSDLSSMLPSILTANDWSIVVSTIKNASKNGTLLNNLYLSNSFIADLTKYLISTMDKHRDKIEDFRMVFYESKLSTEHLLHCFNLILSNEFSYNQLSENTLEVTQTHSPLESNIPSETNSYMSSPVHLTNDSSSEDNNEKYVELYSILSDPTELFEMIELELKKELLTVIANMNKVLRSDKSKVSSDNTEKLISYLMECELTLKAFDSVNRDKVDTTPKLETLKSDTKPHKGVGSPVKSTETVPKPEIHVLLQFMSKELCSSVFKLLLERYLTNNKLVEDPVSADSNNRTKLIELIVDEDIKTLFKDFVTHLRNKDAHQCLLISRDLCKLMYINYNVKKDSRNFIRLKLTHFNQQLSSLTKLDSILTCYASLNIILLKANHYVFFCDKLWSIREVLKLFHPILSSSPNLPLIESIVKLIEPYDSSNLSPANRTNGTHTGISITQIS